MRWLAFLFAGASASAAPPVTAVAFTPDGRAVVAGSQAGLEVRAWPGLTPVKPLTTELSHVHDLAFSPDGTTLAAVGGTPGRRGTVELFRWPGGELVRRFSPHRDLIYAIAWKADPAAFATAGADGVVGVHSTTDDAVTKLEGHSKGVLAAAFLPGDGLLTGGIDASLRLWDLKSGAVARTFSNHTLAVHDFAVRPGNSVPPMVASVGDDRTVRFWQPTVGRMVRFARLGSVPLAVAWTPDGAAVVVACKDGHVRAINPDTAEVGADLPVVDGPAYCLVVAQDGSIVVGGWGGLLRRVVLPETAE